MYLRKNVNFSLLVLVLTVLVGTVAITTYFQSTYKGVSEDLTAKKEQLEVISSNFTTKIKELNKTYSELQLKKIDKDKLDQLYTDLVNEKEKVDAELAVTTGKLTETLTELERKKDELSDANYKLLLQEDEITDLTAKVSNLNTRIKGLNDDVDTLKKQICALKTSLSQPC